MLGCPALEPTYEGLKQPSADALRALVRALEPTYEGLKHQLFCFFCICYQALEPTYEGLKLVRGSGAAGVVVELWSLPMRD